MTELKTLKDIEYNQKSIFDDYSKEGVIEGICLELKQEAIKWIKLYRESGTADLIRVDVGLMNFFNITEEEIK